MNIQFLKINEIKIIISIFCLLFFFADLQLTNADEVAIINGSNISSEKKDSLNIKTELNISVENQLSKEINRYRRLVQTETFDEADNVAKRVIELAIKVHGTESKEFARALINLGVIQDATGQYDAAIQNFSSAIEIIESVDDRLNLSLVEPLKGLGGSQLAIGRLNEAKKTFHKAAHITHVNEGPHNLIQIEILESIVEILFRIGNVKEVRNTLDRINILNIMSFEDDPVGLLPSLQKHADWQNRLGYYRDERKSYKKIIKIIESNYGNDSKLLIKPLLMLGKSFYFIDKTVFENERATLTGEMYFKRAIRIAEKTNNISDQEYISTKLALADCYVYEGLIGRARAIYANIWRYLSTNEERLILRDEYFSKPKQIIKSRNLPKYADSLLNENTLANETAAGKIVVSYDISFRGRVQKVVSEAFPKEFIDMKRVVEKEIRNRVYRPKIIDGKLEGEKEIIFEHSFIYRLSDLEDLKKD